MVRVTRLFALWAVSHGRNLAQALDNGLANTPPMGWNDWNTFACDVSEELLLQTSERVVSLGLRDLGYQTVVLDDCWQDVNGRDKNGKVHANPDKFPRGMKYISDHLHSLGLKFGMYSSAGEKTCARFEGSLDHETADAESFASYGIDLLKYDNCFHMGRMGTPLISFNRYKVMADALNATGRPILLSLCNWGEDYVHTWGMSIAQAWRISGDIYDSFSRPDDLCSCGTAADPHCIAPGTHCSVLFIINKVAPFVDRSNRGGYNDLDMLEVGRGGMTDEEYKAHFAMWAALKSPLMLGNDLRTMSAEALTIVNNPAIIALSQDPLSRSVARVRRDVGGALVPDEFGVAEAHVWSGRLHNGDQAVIFLNAAGEEATMRATLSEIFVAAGPGGSAPQVKQAWAVHDLWAHRMSVQTASALLSAQDDSARAKVYRDANWYNSTGISYAEGLDRNDARLFGEKVAEIEPRGVLEVNVPCHAAKVFRLRRIPENSETIELKAEEQGPRKDEL